ncbi:hypothetical protein RA280_41585 [Cupriavidus sp. CV2]|uniref:hypothetical protein n=1 Tax=Cupriavidus ulmosensis TaxID=3065913 RepID=UPI00296B1A2F|nr:hypothetical protein [Cupriavidus sp. CV2]MDW3688113.1 hypothetical protein [Cupriavidus sp. CV2]
MRTANSAQQSASLVEEATAASASLEDQARQPNQAIAAFRVLAGRERRRAAGNDGE